MMASAAALERLKVITFKELRSDLLWAYDDVVDATNLASPMSPTQTIAWLIRSGGVLVRQGSNTITARAGMWIFPAMMMGWQQFKPGTKLLSIRFTARWLDNRRSLFEHKHAVLIASADAPALERTGSDLARAVLTHAGKVVRGGGMMPDLYLRAIDVGSHFDIQARFSNWLSVYANTMQQVAGMRPTLPQVHNAKAIAAMRLIEDHPLTQPLREAAIARRIGTSVSQMNRLFLRYFDSTPKRWFDTRRREYAVNALTHSDVQIKSIAFTLGFSSLPHFTKWFRRQTGQPPLQFRKSRQLPAPSALTKNGG